MNILVTGDIFIPSRAAKIPTKIQDKIESANLEAIVCTGNFTSSKTLQLLQTFSENLLFSKGPLDDFSILNYDFRVFQGLKIGTTNTNMQSNDRNSLLLLAKEHGLHVICTNGKLGVEKEGKVTIIRSGSLTGVEQEPGFAVINMKNSILRVYLYKLVNEKFIVEEVEVGRIQGLKKAKQLLKQQEEVEEAEEIEQEVEDKKEVERFEVVQPLIVEQPVALKDLIINEDQSSSEQFDD